MLRIQRFEVSEERRESVFTEMLERNICLSKSDETVKRA